MDVQWITVRPSAPLSPGLEWLGTASESNDALHVKPEANTKKPQEASSVTLPRKNALAVSRRYGSLRTIGVHDYRYRGHRSTRDTRAMLSNGEKAMESCSNNGYKRAGCSCSFMMRCLYDGASRSKYLRGTLLSVSHASKAKAAFRGGPITNQADHAAHKTSRCDLTTFANPPRLDMATMPASADELQECLRLTYENGPILLMRCWLHKRVRNIHDTWLQVLRGARPEVSDKGVWQSMDAVGSTWPDPFQGLAGETKRSHR